MRDGLSGLAGAGDSLWLACDETLTVERVDRRRIRPPLFAGHVSFKLEDFIRIPGGPHAEADLEDLDIASGYLWLVGSHAASRKMPDAAQSSRKVAKALARVERPASRCLLARIPMVETDGTQQLRRRAGHGGRKRVAGRLEDGPGGNALTAALRGDEHFREALAMPGKENGLDIEGLAVVGDRVLLGLRGPVFNAWAAIVEIEPRPARDHPSLLRLAHIGHGRKLYRKHFLPLDGLGIRGLARQGLDLLVLAGPTAAIDGPARVYRWIGGARSDVQRRVRPGNVIPVMELPVGRGNDRPEAIVVVPSRDGRDRLLVVYERAARSRYLGAHGVVADLFVLPA
ncbi:hypothetical protein BWI17_06935 [Betaproteobacteria bacterium GR16-43]|nr:hypothetical protein BWI17_06935 [Betaproteobacteria bacterium GR16-43]